MKIFMGIMEIAGHYAKLQDGFASMGVECTFVNLFNHHFKYKDAESGSILIKIKNLILRNLAVRNTNFVLKSWWYGWWIALNILFFLYAVIKYDVFIFGFTSASLWYRGLPILKYMNKKIVCRFHGDDLRPPYLSGSFAVDVDQFSVAECIRLAAEKKEMARKILQHLDVKLCSSSRVIASMKQLLRSPSSPASCPVRTLGPITHPHPRYRHGRG